MKSLLRTALLGLIGLAIYAGVATPVSSSKLSGNLPMPRPQCVCLPPSS